ncbi:MAG: hypothetical protein WCS42_14195 [Verrucomicrobiota bacterium]
MKRLLFTAGLSFVIVACTTNCVLVKDPPTSAEQLRQKFESALKARDTNAAMSLFYLDGLEGDGPYRRTPLSSAETQAAFLREMWLFFPTNVSKIKVAPLPKEFQALHAPKEDDGMGDDWNGDNGWRMRWSVPPVGMFESQPPAMFPTPLIYGKTNGAFYIGIPIVYTAPGKSLFVQVQNSPDSTTYTGSWVFVKGGKEVTVNISDKTNEFRECWGDYIKSCTIHRTSTNEANWFHFRISEDDTNIFESGEITNEEPLIYERKQ